MWKTQRFISRNMAYTHVFFWRCYSDGTHPFVAMKYYVDHGLASGGDYTLTDEPAGNSHFIDVIQSSYVGRGKILGGRGVVYTHMVPGSVYLQRLLLGLWGKHSKSPNYFIPKHWQHLSKAPHCIIQRDYFQVAYPISIEQTAIWVVLRRATMEPT